MRQRRSTGMLGLAALAVCCVATAARVALAAPDGLAQDDLSEFGPPPVWAGSAWTLPGISFLEPGARLVLAHVDTGPLGTGPYPYIESLWLVPATAGRGDPSVTGTWAREVTSLAGEVCIWSPAVALQYVRIASSPALAYCWEGAVPLEVLLASEVTRLVLFGRENWGDDDDGWRFLVEEAAKYADDPAVTDQDARWWSKRNLPMVLGRSPVLESLTPARTGAVRPFGVLSEEEWKGLGLSLPSVTTEEGDYVVVRWVAPRRVRHAHWGPPRGPGPEDPARGIYSAVDRRLVKLRERVTRDGHIERTIDETRMLPDDIAWDISMPYDPWPPYT